MTGDRAFPKGFVWGAATASYQIEGAAGEDGRGESIWDRFSHTPGKVLSGDTGDVACDHYHRWKDDIALMQELGLDAYRFSIAWPRIVPAGTGAVNAAGLAFYDQLVDGLLDAGIEPFVTLYHWDLPQALEDDGGWPVRDTAEAFAVYAGIVAERLGDRVKNFATLNEPWVSAVQGYLDGSHAPGRTSLPDSLAAAHHLLLAHGLGVQAVRAAARQAQVGVVLDFEPKHPASDHELDVEAAAIAHARMNRWYIEPISGRSYPEIGVEATKWRQEEVRDGDLDIIAQPIDFLGVNYYTREVVRDETMPASRPNLLVPGGRKTDLNWEVYPTGLGEIVDWLWAEFDIDRFYVTENGAAYHDSSDVAPFVDEERRTYIRDHLSVVLDLIDRGVPLAGYFVWSLLDNFEWSWGYGHRFGIVRVDYETQERTVRHSGRWYADVIASGAVPAD